MMDSNDNLSSSIKTSNFGIGVNPQRN